MKKNMGGDMVAQGGDMATPGGRALMMKTLGGVAMETLRRGTV